MKEFLSQKGVGFEERNIARNPEHLRELQRMGHRSIPVTIVGDEVLVGFDRRRLERLIG